jgi:hypothetical protein
MDSFRGTASSTGRFSTYVLVSRSMEMHEGIVGQPSHSGEALYNIISAALSKHDEVWQDAEKARQLCSRLIEILNVPLRVRLRLRFACGLADSLFEHPEVGLTATPLPTRRMMEGYRGKVSNQATPPSEATPPHHFVLITYRRIRGR